MQAKGKEQEEWIKYSKEVMKQHKEEDFNSDTEPVINVKKEKKTHENELFVTYKLEIWKLREVYGWC